MVLQSVCLCGAHMVYVCGGGGDVCAGCVCVWGGGGGAWRARARACVCMCVRGHRCVTTIVSQHSNDLSTHTHTHTHRERKREREREREREVRERHPMLLSSLRVCAHVNTTVCHRKLPRCRWRCPSTSCSHASQTLPHARCSQPGQGMCHRHSTLGRWLSTRTHLFSSPTASCQHAQLGSSFPQ